MNYHIKNSFRMAIVAVCGALLGASCTDTWDDHYGSDVMSGEGTTLSYLQANASDFAEVLQAAGYAEKLGSSQMMTILAPQNGSFDKDALLKMIADGEKKDVVDRFIENHILLYNVSLNNDEKTAYLLNDKKVQFGTLADKKIGGVDVLKENIVCGNGIIHILDGDIEYDYNVYERLAANYKAYLAENGLTADDDVISLYSFMKQFDIDSLDETHSVVFGQDEFGNIVYSDSVIIRDNSLLRNFRAYLYREDSLYWVLDPGVEAYQKFYNEAKTYYNFNKALSAEESVRDSLQRHVTQFNLVSELLYNAKLNKGDAEKKTTRGDSLVTTTFRQSDWKHHNYKAPFTAPKGILSNVENVIECSNGYIFQLPKPSSLDDESANTLPITVYDAFFHEVKIETDDRTVVGQAYDGRKASEQWTNESTSTRITHSANADSISGSYFRVQAAGTVSQPMVSFKLSNTLSGTYDIYIVMLPWTVYNENATAANLLPVKFKATLYEANENSVIPYLDKDENAYKFNPGGNDDVVLYSNTTKVDTVYVGTHTFKYCYQYTNGGLSAYLKLDLKRANNERNTYSNSYLIDFIYLVPHRDDVDPKERFKHNEEAVESNGDDPDNNYN